MQPVIYDVAVSLDGYISGPNGDISQFAHTGPVVDQYVARLAGYGAALMGRNTYEFGYGFGLAAGDNPYPHMPCFVISATLDLSAHSAVTVLSAVDARWLRDLKSKVRAPIYLCGGGILAASMLAAGQIDLLRLKRAPIVLGGGVPLFAPGPKAPTLPEHISTHDYGDGTLLQEFRLR